MRLRRTFGEGNISTVTHMVSVLLIYYYSIHKVGSLQ